MGSSQSRVKAQADQVNKSVAKGEPDVIDKLTEAQLDEFREAFATFDHDGGGSIDAKELKLLMASVGQVPSDDELHEMIRIADADGSGSVDFCEFVTLMAHKMADVKSEGALKMSFSVFDATGDGYMDSEELRNLMINVGEPVTIDDVNTLIKEVDRNGDGKVDYEEFVKLIASEDGGRTVTVDGAPSAAPAKQKTKKGRSRQAREEEQMIDKSELRAAALNSADTEHRQRSSPTRGKGKLRG